MALTFGQIILYSRRPEPLARFLSDLLDMEIKSTEKNSSEIILSSGLVTFKILMASGSHLFSTGGERDTLVEFALSSMNEIEDLIHKIQFMSYRMGQEERSSTESEKVELQKNQNEYFFYLKDLDSRKWKFTYKE